MLDVFLFAYVLPTFREAIAPQKAKAEDMWNEWLVKVEDEARLEVLLVIKQQLKDLLLECSTLAS